MKPFRININAVLASPRALFFFLVLIFLLNLLALAHKRLTYDEGNHYQYGINILNGDSHRFDDSKMPVSALNALPKKIWDKIEPHKLAKPLRFLGKMRTGRYMTVIFSLIVGAYIYRWSRKLYGPSAGFLSLFLYTFSPNILAHSRLITTDLFAAGTILIALYYFWKFINQGGWRRGLTSAIALGLSQLAKYTAVYLYPLFFVLAVCFQTPVFAASLKEWNFAVVRKKIRSFFVYTFLFLSVSLVLINAGFLFNRSFTKLGDYQFRSEFFQKLQSKHPLAEIPVPVPYPYVEGLDLVKYYDQSGKADFKNYLFGELRKGEGFRGYYFFAYLFKEPIAIQLLFLWALFHFVRHRRKFSFFRNEAFLLIPLAFFFIYFNFFFRVDLGIRFFIVALPLIYVFIGSLFRDWGAFSTRSKMTVAGLAGYLVISVMSYAPHFLSYFNELVWDRKTAYKIMADSNLDWGENTWYLEHYTKRHPEAVVDPASPVPGSRTAS